LTDVLVVGMVKNKANDFVTSGNAILKFYMIRYLSMSEILHYKNSSYEQKVQFSEEENQNAIHMISIMTHKQ
jgi:hypothetical protein